MYSHRKIKKFFIFVQVFTGADYGYMEQCPIKIKLAVKMISFLQWAVVISGNVPKYWNAGLEHHVGNCFNLAQFSVIFFNLNLAHSKTRSLRKFYEKLYKLDVTLNSSRNFKTKNPIVCCIVVFLLLRGVGILSLIMRCQTGASCESSILEYYLLEFPFVFIDLWVGSYIGMYYAASLRLKTLHDRVSSDLSDVLQRYHLYNNLYNVIDESRRSNDALFAIQVICMVPVLIYISTQSFLQGDVFNYIKIFRFVMTAVIVIIGPSITAGEMANTAKKIKKALHEQLSITLDKQQEQGISDLISFVDLYPLEFYASGFIKLDAHLITTVVQTIVTYFIILVQLSNKE